MRNQGHLAKRISRRPAKPGHRRNPTMSKQRNPQPRRETKTVDIRLSPLGVQQAGAPDNALDEVFANGVECLITLDSRHQATISISKDGDTRRFVIGVINPGPGNEMILLINEWPPCEYTTQPDEPEHMLRCHLPAGSVHLETLADDACYIGLFADTEPPSKDQGLIIATTRETGTMALTPVP